MSVAGAVFVLVAIMHLLRALNGWEMNIDTFSAPMWASWVGFVVAGYLAYQGLKKR